jgi:hypothetical protein
MKYGCRLVRFFGRRLHADDVRMPMTSIVQTPPKRSTDGRDCADEVRPALETFAELSSVHGGRWQQGT